MALVPVGPAGLLDCLQSSSRELHAYALRLPASLQSRKYKKFQCFCSHGNLSVENSENPQSEHNEKRGQSRFSHLRNHLQGWSARPIVKRHKFPWEERQGKEEERVQNVSVGVDGKKEDEKGFNLAGVPPRSLPTAPWMQALDKSHNKEGSHSSLDDIEGESGNESEQDDDFNVGDQFRPLQNLGRRGKKSVAKEIVTRLQNFDYPEQGEKSELLDLNSESSRSLIDEMFNEEEPRTFNNKQSGCDHGRWTAPSRLGQDNDRGPFPWDNKGHKFQGGDGLTEGRRVRRPPSLAEQTIPEPELNRLRGRGIRLKERIKMGSAGVTREIVEKVHERWRNSEIVKFKCEGSSALNMKRTHHLLERRTGGMVIWRSGGSVVLYRGMTYEPPYLKAEKLRSENNQGISLHSEAQKPSPAENLIRNKAVNGVDKKGRNTMLGMDMWNSHVGTEISDDQKPLRLQNEPKYENEMSEILDELGPRFTDWAGCDPLPVDADLLPKVVPGYKEPFRLLPYGVRYSLSNLEMTNLRKLAREIPPHFALGRNRQHQGLAAAIVKLWEKSSIAKIAIKRGVQNTSNERMAEEIKKLTGGTILSRNKEFIVIYRGKDFLSPDVSAALVEREAQARALQDEEESARLKASSAILGESEKAEAGPSLAGTLAESLEAKARWSKHMDSEDWEKTRIAAAKAKKADIARKLVRKMELAQKKVAKAEKDLAKVEKFLLPAKPSSDQETITDEERFMFRKLGLKMKAFLLLGRRGIFDGTVENMHLHWKHRELVKVISKERSLAEVKYTALMLEAESGGILVSVDKVSKGYAILVYRGKNYQRPLTIKPKTLLTKRKALKRSIELQRRESLNRHILQLERNMEQLRFELSRIGDIDEDQSTADFNAELGSVYLSEDAESEDEDEDGDEDEDEDGVEEDEGLYQEFYGSYSENKYISSKLDETPKNHKTMEENVTYSDIREINFELDSVDGSDVEEEALDRYEVELPL